MELRQLTAFVKVAQYKSFTRAAEVLGYSQSAVTVQIRLLEEELGTRLFDRINKQVALTSPGSLFLESAYRILNEANNAKLSITDPDLHGTLQVGMLHSIMFSEFPPILKELHREHPRMTIRITAGSPEELIEKMELDQLDLIYILDEPRYNNSWHKEMEVKEEIVFVCSPEMEVASREKLTVSDLLPHPFFLTEKSANYRRALDSFLASRDIVLEPFMEVGNTEFIVKMVKENPAVTFLPYSTVRESVEAGSLRILPVQDFRLSMYRQIFYHRVKLKTKEMEEFIRLAKKE